MHKHNLKIFAVLAVALSAAVFSSLAQEPAAPGGGQGRGQGKGKGGGRGPAARPVLVFKEEWKQTEKGGEHPFAAEDVSSANLDFKVYGVKTEDLLLTGSGRDGDPIHVWTGLCPNACGLTLKDKNNYADLTGLARIRWVTKVSGFHQVRPVIRLADGTMLVGSYVSNRAPIISPANSRSLRCAGSAWTPIRCRPRAISSPTRI